jgi:hypothetical protein
MSALEEADTTPVRLFEDADTGHHFLIYGTERGLKVELRYEGDALWMTQAQMATLFGRDVSVISRHIANILEEGELLEESNLHFMQIARSTKPVALYSLDMIISVGYRVSSTQATLFRKWATGVLVRFASKGFVVDADRLKNPEDQDRVRELREIVRDIRASEANVYAELRRICAFCQDYEPSSQAASEFYRRTQAKLLYAVVNQTPSEVLAARADSKEPNMGLQSWLKDDIRQADAVVAKNYLAPGELKELNRLTTILLDIFDDQLEIGRLVLMDQAAQLLDEQLAGLKRVVLDHGGRVRHDQAEAKAKGEYRKFEEARKVARREAADRGLADLKRTDAALPKVRPPRNRPEKP